MLHRNWPNKGKSRYIVLMIAAVLLLGAVVGAVVYFTQSQNEQPSVPSGRIFGERLEEEASAEASGSSLEDRTWELSVMARKIFTDGDGSSVDDECHYDRFGNVIQRAWYDADGNIRFWVEYWYDAFGNKTMEKWYNSLGNSLGLYEYEYDDSGNQVKVLNYLSPGEFYSATEYEYDDSGNRTKEITYDRMGDIEEWHEYEYDSYGSRVKDTSYDENRNVGQVNLYQYEYDAAGNIVAENWYHQGQDIDELWLEKVCVYNDAGNLLRESCSMKDKGSLYADKDRYNAPDNLFRVVGTSDNRFIYYWYECEYEYDTHGNTVKRTAYDLDGSIRDWCEYEYDESGNLLTEIYFGADQSMGYRYDYEYITLNIIPGP